MVATLDLLFPYGMSHLVNLSTWEMHLMSTWEENLRDGLIGGHLVHEWSSLFGGVTREGEFLQHSPL